MNTKHTPGPWKENSFKVVDSKNNTICLIGNNSGINSFDESNAKLIAASPELLEALKKVSEFIHFINSSDDHNRLAGDNLTEWETYIYPLINSAITKATE